MPARGERETTLDGLRDVRVYQYVDGYRFSVDALLLYSFVHLRHARGIADLGTGSGIIGLLLARKYTSAQVLLIELQESLFSLAQRNITINGLGERVTAMMADIADIRNVLSPISLDVVVSNPPFRKPTTGRLSIGKERQIARHEMRMTLPDLAGAASYLLKEKGRFFMIYHPERLLEAIDTLRQNRLEPKRARFAHNDPDSVSKMVLIEAVKDGQSGMKVERPLFIYKPDGSYTDEVQEMYG